MRYLPLLKFGPSHFSSAPQGALRPATIGETRNPKPNTLGCAGRYLLHISQSLLAQSNFRSNYIFKHDYKLHVIVFFAI